MPSPRILSAEALKAALEGILDDAYPAVVVTLDHAIVPSAARGAGCILIDPPELAFETYESTEASFEIHVIYGDLTQPRAAWERIDSIIAALEDGELNMRSASPGSYAPIQGNPLPAYTIKLNPLD